MSDEFDDDYDVSHDDVDDIDVADMPDELDDEQTDNPSDEFDLDFSFDEPAVNADDELERLRQENQRLHAERKQWQQHDDTQPTLRPRPTIFDHDYDHEAFDADLDAWLEEKAEYEKAVSEHQGRYQQIEQRYFDSVENFSKIAKDYQEVENTVAQSLSLEKQALLKMAVDDVAPLAYVLGKSPQKLAELSKLDEVSFLVKIGAMQEQMQMKRQTRKPSPKDHELTGVAGGGDAKLAKLEAEALRTGDRTALVAYRRALKKR